MEQGFTAVIAAALLRKYMYILYLPKALELINIKTKWSGRVKPFIPDEHLIPVYSRKACLKKEPSKLSLRD